MAISAVLFDFDGVLVDTEWAIYQAWLRTFRNHGHDLPLEVYTRCIGSDFQTWSPKTHLEELSGLTFDWHDLDTRRQVEIIRDLEEEKPMPGVIGMLDKLSAQGIRKAVVSSSSHHWVDGWLNKLDLMDRFETVVCRGDAPRIKPAPDLYLEAAARLQLEPSECLVIEDSLNGVKAAKAAGMPVWVIPNRVTLGLDFTGVENIFPDMEKLAESI